LQDGKSPHKTSGQIGIGFTSKARFVKERRGAVRRDAAGR